MSYVFLDLETTGLDADNCFITEVAALKTNEYGDELARFHSLVKLPAGEEVPEFITGLTGITTQQLVENGSRVEGVMRILEDFIGNGIVVAQYAPFDLSFIEKHFEVDHFFDTRTLAYALNHEKAGLKDLTAHYGVELTEHHRAMSDSVACKEIFFAMLRELGAAAGELKNVVGIRADRVPSVFPKNTVAKVDYTLPEKEVE